MRLAVLLATLVIGSDAMAAIIPQPREMARRDGAFAWRADTPLLLQSGQDDLAAALDYARRVASEIAGAPPAVARAPGPADGAVFLGRLDGAAGDEEYTLEVTPARVALRAAAAPGLVRGLASLRQLAGTGREVPAVAIADGPRFAWRGLMLDCCRHFMPVEVIERVLDLMALHKLNRFHWHLTEDQAWRLSIARYPRLVEVGARRREPDGSVHEGYYTADDARRVVARAAALGITVVPEIELPGHARAAIAAYPELSCRGEPLPVPCWWGVFEDVYCVGDDATFTFVTGVLEEVLAIFPSREIHVGGDEVPRERWRACPRCQARIAAEGLAGEAALQSWFVGRVGAWLAERGRRLVGWDEILEGGALPAGAIVQSWRGFDGAAAAAAAGHDVVVSPTSHCYLDYDVGVIDLARALAFEPVPAGLAPGLAPRVLGGEMNLWTERAPADLVPARLLPRLLALSEALWSPAASGRDLTEFRNRVQDHRPLLEALGWRCGPEARPLRLAAAWDPAASGWRVAAEVAATLPAGEREVRWDVGGAAVARDDSAGAGVLVSAAGPVAARLLVGGAPYGEPARLELAPSLALARPVAADPAPSPRYAPTRPHPLTDGVLGSLDIHDGGWLAWQGEPRVTLTLDLGAPVPVRSARARFLQDAGSWIWVPDHVVFSTSPDSSSWQTLGRDEARIPHLDHVLQTQDYEALPPASAPTAPTTARYLRLDIATLPTCPPWHPGAGQPAWIFCSQVTVE